MNTSTGRGKRPGLRARSKNARVRAPRITVSEREELYGLRVKVRRAREIMEVNDPLNARDIFGPPEHEPPAVLEETARAVEDDVYL